MEYIYFNEGRNEETKERANERTSERTDGWTTPPKRKESQN